MSTNTFKLTDYVREIRSIADENKCTPEQALQYFLANLAIMRERYKGAPHLNFHQLGQMWNGLPGKERNEQKETVRTRLTRATRGGSTE